MQSGFITLHNQEAIYYEEWGAQFIGKQPSVLFVHGNFSDCEWWYDTIEGLKHIKQHFIAVDLRGFGKSTYKTPCNSFKFWAQDLKELCKSRGIEKCVVNGWSFGGAVSMKLAEIAPELVTKIILTCSVSSEGLKFETDGKFCKTREELLQNQFIKLLLQLQSEKDVEKLMQFYENAVFAYCKEYPLEKKQKRVKSCFDQRCIVDVVEAMANSDIDISKIKIPALMIHGKEDHMVPLEGVKSTGQYFKNFIILENSGHMIPFENPKLYQQLVLKFIGGL